MEVTVTDKYGKRVTRNGVLQHGDCMTVPLRMIDAADPGLVAAAALADAVRRNEAFDARQHRPGFVATQDAYDAGDKLREARDARVRDAWKTPPSVTTSTATAIEQVAVVGHDAPDAQLFAARDQALAFRDARTRDAWKAA